MDWTGLDKIKKKNGKERELVGLGRDIKGKKERREGRNKTGWVEKKRKEKKEQRNKKKKGNKGIM